MTSTGKRIYLNSKNLEGSKSASKTKSFSKGDKTLDMDKLIANIKKMKPYADNLQANLDENTKQELKKMGEAAWAMRKGKAYHLIINAIKETFGDTKNIRPMT